ncbi:S26 family signal peptidase [Nocardioides nanhaiensis]|uniref:Signal peptidase I n=1 Tax=Nocardioides nanhaiensis TaxID=1476871 RepID=A0ABP8WZ15_9ACTN
MEIATQPPTRRHAVRTRRLVVALVLAPVTLLVVLPTMLGLERYVVSSDAMGGTLRPGTLLLERRVPAGDLEVGDVVTVPRPGADERADGEALLTHRVVSLAPGEVRTQADRAAQPVTVSTRANPTLARVELAVPLVGLPLLVDADGWVWGLLTLLATVVLAALGLVRPGPRPVAADGRRRGPRVVADARPTVGAGTSS